VRALGYVLLIPACFIGALVLINVLAIYLRVIVAVVEAAFEALRAYITRRRIAREKGWATGWDRVRS
jgi:hypothetical protein